MPNIGSLLKAEISRLSRREIRGEVASLKKASAASSNNVRIWVACVWSIVSIPCHVRTGSNLY